MINRVTWRIIPLSKWLVTIGTDYLSKQFTSQISDKMDRWSSRGGKSQRREEKRRSKRKRYVFPMLCGPGGWKSRLAQAAGKEPSGEMRDRKVHAGVALARLEVRTRKHTIFGALLEVETWKKCTPTVGRRCETHFQVRMLKERQVRSTFGS